MVIKPALEYDNQLILVWMSCRDRLGSHVTKLHHELWKLALRSKEQRRFWFASISNVAYLRTRAEIIFPSIYATTLTEERQSRVSRVNVTVSSSTLINPYSTKNVFLNELDPVACVEVSCMYLAGIVGHQPNQANLVRLCFDVWMPIRYLLGINIST